MLPSFRRETQSARTWSTIQFNRKRRSGLAVKLTTDNEAWQAASPAEAATWLSAVTARWWFAGGWALDLFMGEQSRPHADLDVGILRRDAPAVIAALPDWEFFEAKDGSLTPLDAGAAPRASVNSLWCRPKNTESWKLEFMLDEGADGLWIYRRNSEIQRLFVTAVKRTADGLRYLAPEIQLLYKARHCRSRDHADFNLVTPRLDAQALAWLRDALSRTDPGHTWLQAIQS